MKIDVYLDEKTFRNFTMFDVLERRKAWKSPVIFACLMTGFSIPCFVLHHIDGAVLLGSVLAIIGLGMPILYFSTFFSSLKKQVKQQKLKPARLVYSLNLEDKVDGIGISNGREKACYKWKDVHSVYRTEDAIYIFMTETRAFLIPEKDCQSVKETYSLIRRRVGDAKCKDLRKKQK